MMRAFFIYLSKAAWARKLVTQWQFAWRAASRFIAGEKLEDGIRVVKELNAKGINATLDHLGENVTTAEESQRATRDLLAAIDAIVQSGVRANISVKLTQIGLVLDENVCRENLAQIIAYAQKHDIFVRIDMEDSARCERTFKLYNYMVKDCHFQNTGIVIQSYLYRSEEDIRQIVADGGKVRLCKGAYKEPADVAFPKKKDVDESYDKLARMLMDGSKAAGMPLASENGVYPPPPALATHDPQRVAASKAYAQQIGLPKKAIEFQMLNGIRRDLQELLSAEGYPVRVYVPYGTEWYPYFVRRLAERPANVWFFISNFFHK